VTEITKVPLGPSQGSVDDERDGRHTELRVPGKARFMIREPFGVC